MNNTPFDPNMADAIKLAHMQDTGGPFGAIIVKDNKVVGAGKNEVLATNDPTAHAEMMAIRHACKNVGDFKLTGATLYTSCEPCPMCLSAAYWAGINTIYYGCTREDAAAIGFDDAYIYEQLNLPMESRGIPMIQMNRNEALKAFEAWMDNPNREMY